MDNLHLTDKHVAVKSGNTSGSHSPVEVAADVFDNNVSAVAEKYRGTDADHRDMSVLGKKQVLRVSTYDAARING